MTTPVPGLPANDSIVANLPITPQPAWPDSVYGVLSVDIGNTVAESNESNNTMRFPAEGAAALVIERVSTGPVSIEFNTDLLSLANSCDFGELTVTVRQGGDVVPADIVWVASNDDVIGLSDEGSSATVNGRNGVKC